jgi:kynurenine formamidase
VVFGLKPSEGTLGSGFLVHEYRHVGQWGTHVDPPAHFIEGGRNGLGSPLAGRGGDASR